MRDIKEFGAYITNKRKEAGLTQEALANKIGITPQAVSKWENGIGYPDVTLFSVLAKALNVSISELFGEEVKREEGFVLPNTYRGMPKVYENQGIVCYSAKKTERICEEGGTLYFSDGSYVELNEKRVINKGTGEVIVAPIEDIKKVFVPESGEKYAEKFFETFQSIELVIGSGNNSVIIEKGERPKIEIIGSEAVISAFDTYVKEGKLCVLQKNEIGNGKKGRILIKAPFDKGIEITANMRGNCTIETLVDWERSVFQCHGNNSVEGHFADYLNMVIRGNSSVEFECIKKQGVFEVSGNSSIEVKEMGALRIGVSGNSSICFTDNRGDMEIKVSGNSSISAGGDIDNLKFEVSGNCDFNGKNLTVNRAEITMLSRGKLHLKQIKDYSVEKIGLNAVIEVEKRG